MDGDSDDFEWPDGRRKTRQHLKQGRECRPESYDEDERQPTGSVEKAEARLFDTDRGIQYYIVTGDGKPSLCDFLSKDQLTQFNIKEDRFMKPRSRIRTKKGSKVDFHPPCRHESSMFGIKSQQKGRGGNNSQRGHRGNMNRPPRGSAEDRRGKGQRQGENAEQNREFPGLSRHVNDRSAGGQRGQRQGENAEQNREFPGLSRHVNDRSAGGQRGQRQGENAEQNREFPGLSRHVNDRSAGGQRGPPRRPNNERDIKRNQHKTQPAGLRPLEAHLTLTRLEELTTKEPSEVVAALSYSKESLRSLLKNDDKLKTDNQTMRLLLSALGKVCLCQSMPAQMGEILNLVRTSDFLHHLGTFLTLGSASSDASDVTRIIGESADLLRTLVELFPSHLHEVVMAHAFIEMAQTEAKRRGGELPPQVLKKIEDLEIAKNAAMEGLQHRQARARRGYVDEDGLTPPEDFRQLSVFPTQEDLNREAQPFLRKNKDIGGYGSVDHYLDVQFRLLREDFVYPLREGIAEYLAMLAAPQQGKKLRDIRVYHDVHILRAVCLNSGLGHRLTFDISRLSAVRWEVTKRLIYGSLVCLSADNFRTLYFATVANREPSELQEGLVDVMFEHDLAEVSAIPSETVFVMAETTAFFEAYRHVLAGLQRIQANDLPFQRYIVSCDKTVDVPGYLTNEESASAYDLRPLVDDSVMIREDRQLCQQRREVPYHFNTQSAPAESVPILQREEWPDPSLMKLDESQYEALQTALTREFSVIQGPPGTGKTYVGLKIVKALLHNRKAWDPEVGSCMLIVCYTNHALDQFLEGIVSFFKGRVVRVGGQMKSEKLKPYSLANLRQTMRSQREEMDTDFREITRLRFQGHDEMTMLMDKLEHMGQKIEVAKREILREDMLRPYMLNKHYEGLQSARQYLLQQHGQFEEQGKTKKKVFCIPEWLGIGAVLQNSHVTAQDLETLDAELGEDDVEIEGEIQALEEHNKLDTGETSGDQQLRKEKESEKKKAQARVRASYLAVDLSGLDQARDKEEQAAKGGGGGGGGGRFQIPTKQWKKLKRKLRRNVEQGDRMTEAEERQVADVWRLENADRWKLYRRWTHNLCQAMQTEMAEKERLYDELARRHKETLLQEDKHVLKTATVIAMTTTGAAKYQSILEEVKPKVIVVEEAAEVLEGHVITTLSQDCQHLILIGDHKQLRPSPNVFSLARKYNLELSLFERMINNGLKCVTLGWQHRMRPEIATLVKPIYPDLKNHPSVDAYEAVKGVSSNLFFIDHTQPEVHDDESKSHSNVYEAVYIARLCSYLLKQGYAPSRITVLTTYSGQLYQLKKLMPKKSEFEDVRVTVVDNFQGEESDIILLSLVRSNEDSSIGFLKIENRVCVALSRAKMGLYVIGNFDLLSAESTLWQTITAGMRKDNKIGEALNLYCQNHPRDEGLVIRTPEDFGRAPEGGCMKPCTARLDCGHVCRKICHPYDMDHEEYKCKMKCERMMDCEFKHRCRKLCHEECGKCQVKVQKVIPKCNHVQWVPCSKDPSNFICQEDCEAVLICGHKCGDLCGEPHRCYETVDHRWPCGHDGEVFCAMRDTEPCPKPCGQALACGHRCRGTCTGCHGGRLHQHCEYNCTNTLVCGHPCKGKCSSCPPCQHRCENSCVHGQCQKSCGLPCVPCTRPCVWRCRHHRCTKLCSEPCDRPTCEQPCRERLKCNHPCIGLCGERCPTLCRICDHHTVDSSLFGSRNKRNARFVQLEDCAHIVEVNALDRLMTTATGSRADRCQLKACPHCQTPIRRNLRYGDIIKTQLKIMETNKASIRRDETRIQLIIKDLQAKVEKETNHTYREIKQDILNRGDRQTLGGLNAILKPIQLLDWTKQLQESNRSMSAEILEAVKKLESWVISFRLVFSYQEDQDGETEATRLKHWLHLENYLQQARWRKISLPARVADPCNNMLRKMKEGRVYTKDHQRTMEKLLTQLEELVPESGLGISDKDKDTIVMSEEEEVLSF